ncbi:MAG: lanthionine synthetase C family protein [Bacteroidales bacterium]|nr:lanthionine synthetase C family protein [Bacteroidales bacterium]
MTCKLSDNIGVHAGTSGVALFFAYYDRIIHKKSGIGAKVVEILEHNMMCIESQSGIPHTICNGIAGFGWLCEHLRKMGFLSRDDIAFLDDLDPYLYSQMMDNIKFGNYDFLHGALGVGTYFIDRLDKKEVPGYLNDLLTELEESSIPCRNGGVKWMSIIDHKTSKIGYNISLSHGMSAIAALLIRLHQMNFETQRVESLLSGTILFILDQIIYQESSLSYFPSRSKVSGTEASRLGWCYGDLGVVCVLRRAAIALRNKEWEEMALKILLHTCKRRDLEENIIRDAGLCHGSAGVAYIFWDLYAKTDIAEFKETVDYWLDITLQMAKYPDGLAGYKAFRLEEYGGLEKTDSLLDGIAGIGLALLSCLNDHATPWDECFMLS